MAGPRPVQAAPPPSCASWPTARSGAPRRTAGGRSAPGAPRPAPTGCWARGPRRPPSRWRRPWRTATCWSAPVPGRTRRHDRAGSPDEQAGRRCPRPSGATASAAARAALERRPGPDRGPAPGPLAAAVGGRGAGPAAVVPGAELGLAGPGRRRPGRLPGPHGGWWRGAVGRGLAGAAGPGHRGGRPGGGHPDRAVAAAAGRGWPPSRRWPPGRSRSRSPPCWRSRPSAAAAASPTSGCWPTGCCSRCSAAGSGWRSGRLSGSRMVSLLAAPVWVAVCLFGPMVLRESDTAGTAPAAGAHLRGAVGRLRLPPRRPLAPSGLPGRRRPARRRAPAGPGRPGQRPAPAPGADAGGRPGRPAPGRGVRAAAGRPARPGARGRARGGPTASRSARPTTPASTPTRRSSIPTTTAPTPAPGTRP